MAEAAEPAGSSPVGPANPGLPSQSMRDGSKGLPAFLRRVFRHLRASPVVLVDERPWTWVHGQNTDKGTSRELNSSAGTAAPQNQACHANPSDLLTPRRALMTTMLPEEIGGIWMTPLDRSVQRCPALRINRVNLCFSARLEEKLDDGDVTVLCSHVKRGKAIFGRCIRISASIQKKCRYIPVFLTDGVMEQRCVVPFRGFEKSRVPVHRFSHRGEIAPCCSSEDGRVILRPVMRR